MKPSKKDFDRYYHYYVDLVEQESVIDALKAAHCRTKTCFQNLSEEVGDYKYQNNKWTIKEILCHIIDTERIFNYRALRFSRSDNTELPGYEHDNYVNNSNAGIRSLEDLFFEYEALRNSTIALYKGFDEAMLNKSGVANRKKLTVLAIGFINVGHEIHHINVIKEKYLSKIVASGS